MESTRYKVVVGVLVALILGGLHLTFRSVASDLPGLFPHIVDETPPEEAPLMLSDISELPEEEVPMPPVTDPIPDSTVPSLPEARNLVSDLTPLKTTAKLLRSTPVTPPEKLPPLRAEEAAAIFKITPALAPIVDFWRKIYGVYDKNQVVLHDTEHLEIQYGVLDFSALNARNISDAAKKTIRESEIQRETRRIQEILTELEAAGGLTQNRQGQRIAALFEAVHEPEKFKKAKDRIRTQTGLKHRFREGIANSGKYMPHFEQIFQSFGVPRPITRLAFVESIFREKAYSKVGAAGLWQFMPDTGRRYMTVDDMVDERYDPLVASQGAARLLLHNYDLLGTWPLAINAYNSGPGNLLKAVSKLGTRDIATIITQYKTGSYAFASRNFYPSFLAALDVYENADRYFGTIHRNAPWKFDTVDTPTTLTFPEIAYLSSSSLDELEELNPSFKEAVFQGGYALPPGSQVRVPAGRRDDFAVRFVSYPVGIEPPVLHVVRNGESVEQIAFRYGVAAHDLTQTNALSSPLSPGRVLLVPNTTSLVRTRFSN